MSQTVTLQLKLDRAGVAPGLREISADVKKAVAAIQEQFASLNAEMKDITFNPRGILAGTDQATRGLESVQSAARNVVSGLRAVKTNAEGTGAELKSLNTQAVGVEKKLTTLAGTSTAVGTALGDMGTAAGTADVALDSLDAGAATAQKSVAGLGRAAGGVFTKLDALSGVVFDPAGIEAGAAKATTALERVKTVAAEVRASVRGAGTGGGGFFVGGRGLAGGAAEEGRPGTFRQGLRAGGSAALDMGTGLAAITTIVAAVSGKLSAQFDNLIQGVRGNTVMTPADEAGMRSQTLRLMRTGSSSEELAQGYKHIVNMGYHGAGAAKIAEFGNRFGIGTHTNVEDTDDFVARIMNSMGHMGPEMVSRVGNVGHFAAAGSNMDIKDLEKNSARSVALTSTYIGPKGLPDTLAAFSALVQHSLTPSRADTQVSGILGQIAAPSPKAEKRAKALGIDDVFNAVGLRSENLSGVMDRVKVALDKLPAVERASALKDLFNNKQGGFGATVLTGDAGHPSYQKALNDPLTGTKAAFEGKIDAITPAYAAQMNQTAQAFKALSGEIQSDFIPAGRKLGPLFLAAIPVVRETAQVLTKLLDGFARLPKPIQETVIAIGGLKLLSGFLPLLGGFSLLSEKTTATIGGLGKMLFGLGGEAAAGEAGLAGTAEVLSGPFALGVAAVVAAVAGLALAWKKDFGGIREFTGGVVKQITGFFRSEMPQIQIAVKTVLGTMQQLWHDHGQRVMAVVTPLWNFVKDTIHNAIKLIENVIKAGLDLITGNWRALGRDLLGIVGNLWDEIKSLFVNGVKLIGNTLALLVSVIYDIGKRLLTAALHVGESIVGGMVQGIKSKVSQVAGAAKDMALSAITSATTVLDIHSPSKVMHTIGEQTAQGMADGILSGVPGVTSAMRKMTAAALAEADPIKARLMIRNDARGLEAGGMKKTAVAGWRDASLTGITERTKAGQGQAHADAHQFDHFFDSQQSGDTHLHAKWENRLADNASYKAYLDTRKQQLQEWGTAHKAWLNTHEAGAKRFQTIESSLDTAIQQVTGRIQKAANDVKAANINQGISDQLDAMNDEGPDKFSRRKAKNLKSYQDAIKVPGVDANAAGTLYQRNNDAITDDQTTATNEAADKKMEFQAEYGEKTLPQALDYFKKRQADLETAGKAYEDEWYEIAGRVKELQRQITDAEKQAADDEEKTLRARFDSLKESFQDGKISIDAYKTSLQALLTDIASYDKTHPDTAPTLEPLRHDVADAGTGAQKKEKQEGLLVGGQPFWDGLASSASEQGSRVLDALLNPKEKKSIFKSMWTDLLQSAEGSLKGGLSAILKNLITGTGGKINLGGLLGGLLGGKKASGASGIASLTDMIGKAQGGGATASPLSNLGGIGSMLSAAGIPAGGALSMLGMTGIPGMGRDPGMGGGSSPLGLVGMLGKGGLGGLFAKGGLFNASGALGGFGAALPWIGGGLALSGLLGNPLGKALKGLKKIFHFELGGNPPVGVPSLVGERGPELFIPSVAGHVFTADQTRAMTGSGGAGISPQGQTTAAGRAGVTKVTVHQHGDHIYTSEMDIKKAKGEWAKDMQVSRRAGIPA